MNRGSLLSAMLLVAGASVGCQVDAAPDPGCAALLGSTTVQYVGHAFGRGEITLQTAPGSGQLVGRMTLRSAEPDEPSLELAATGTCRDGVARMRVAGADHPAAAIRILGGRFVMVHDAELLGNDFGMWRTEVAKKSDGETKSLFGYFRELAAEEIEVARR